MKHRNPSPSHASGAGPSLSLKGEGNEACVSLETLSAVGEGLLESDIEVQLQDTLERLHGLYPKLIDLSLGRIERLLHQLGDPHLHMPPSIHVAGTNGKGSTIATLRSLMEAHGKSVHVMTSPHLVHINERIRLAGKLIDSAALLQVLEEVMAVNGDQEITFFEVFTAATFLIFARTQADFCLIETGLGGRFDASNVIQNPIATILTVISHDHKEFLGDNLNIIAGEKAGIMKPKSPCIVARQPAASIAEGAINTISSHALSTGSVLFPHGAQWGAHADGERMIFTFDGESYTLPRPNLIGDHQIDNAGAALAAWRIISGKALDAKTISTALGQIDWPGRLQQLTGGKLVDMLRPGWELWIDGGHNDSAGKALGLQAKAWAAQDTKPLHLICGMMRNKDPKTLLDPLLPFTESICCIPIPGEKAAFTANELQAYIKPRFPAASIQKDTQSAINMVSDSGKTGRILITGSLYLVGDVLSLSQRERVFF